MHAPSAATTTSKVISLVSKNDSKVVVQQWDPSAKMSELQKGADEGAARARPEESEDPMDWQSQLTEMTRVARHLQSIVIQGRTENSALKEEIKNLEVEVRELESKASSRRRANTAFVPLETLKSEETEERNRALKLRVEELFNELSFFQEKDKTRTQKLVEAQRAAVEAYNRVENLEGERDELMFKHETEIHSLQARLDAALHHIETLKMELEHTLASQGPPNQETAPQAELLTDLSLAEHQDIDPDRGALVMASIALVGILLAAAVLATFMKSPANEIKECPVVMPDEEFNFGAVPNKEFDFGAPMDFPLASNVCMVDDLPVHHLSLAWQHVVHWGESRLSHLVDNVGTQDWRKSLHHHLVHYQQIQQWVVPMGSEMSHNVLETLRDPSDFYPVQ